MSKIKNDCLTRIGLDWAVFYVHANTVKVIWETMMA